MLFRGKIEPPRIKKSHKDLCACGNKEVLCSKNVKVWNLPNSKERKRGGIFTSYRTFFRVETVFWSSKKRDEILQILEQTRLSCHCSYRKMWPGKKIKLGKIYNSDCGEISRWICRSSRFIEVEIKGSTVLILENPTIVCGICLWLLS